MSVVKAHLPFQSETDCFVAVANGEYPSSVPWGITLARLFVPRPHAPFTFAAYDIEELNFNIEPLDNTTVITIRHGYFRFYTKHRDSCVIFMVNPASFEQATRAIHYSGFGTSDSVPFFMLVKSPALIYEFQQNLIGSFAGHPVFHAPVIFFDGWSPFLMMHCYFCPTQPLSSPFPTINEILALHCQINEHGHGLSIIPTRIDQFSKRCFYKNVDHHIRRKLLLAIIRRCQYGIYGLVITPLQSILNFTIFSRNFWEVGDALQRRKWSLQMGLGDTMLIGSSGSHQFKFIISAILGDGSENYAQKRGHLLYYPHPAGNVFDEMAVCAYISQEIGLNYHVLNLVETNVWVSLLFVGLAIVLVYKKIGPALNIFLPLIGVECDSRFPAYLLVIINLFMTIISWISQCYISADQIDFVYSDSTAEIVDFLQMGYRIVVLSPQPVISLFEGQRSDNMKKIRSFLERGSVKSISDLFYHDATLDTKALIKKVYKEGILVAREQISRRKLLVPIGPRILDYGILTKETSIYLDKMYTCRLLTLSKELDLQMAPTLWFWGYMSRRMAKVFETFFETGWIHKVYRLHKNPGRVRRDVSVLKEFTRADKVVQDKPFAIGSTVGITAVMQCSFMATLLVIYIFLLLWQARNFLWWKLKLWLSNRYAFTFSETKKGVNASCCLCGFKALKCCTLTSHPFITNQ